MGSNPSIFLNSVLCISVITSSLTLPCCSTSVCSGGLGERGRRLRAISLSGPKVCLVLYCHKIMWLQSGGAAEEMRGRGTPPDSSKGSLHDVSGSTPLSLQAGNPLDAFFPTLLDWAESRPVHRGMMPLLSRHNGGGQGRGGAI